MLLKLYAFTFCPRSVISLDPFFTNCLASITNSLIDLEYSAPRVYGTTQNLQNLSHPSCIVKNDEILLHELLIEFKLSNFSITSKSVKLIFFDFFSKFKIMLLIL